MLYSFSLFFVSSQGQPMKYLSAANALLLLLVFTFPMWAQSQKPEKKLFHVTEVTEGPAPDYCSNGGCAATLFKVSGFVKQPGHPVIQYILECVEVIPSPENKTGSRSTCARLEAGEDYVPNMYPDAVSFWSDNQHEDNTLLVLYDIRSQREVASTETTTHAQK